MACRGTCTLQTQINSSNNSLIMQRYKKGKVAESFKVLVPMHAKTKLNTPRANSLLQNEAGTYPSSRSCARASKPPLLRPDLHGQDPHFKIQRKVEEITWATGWTGVRVWSRSRLGHGCKGKARGFSISVVKVHSWSTWSHNEHTGRSCEKSRGV